MLANGLLCCAGSVRASPADAAGDHEPLAAASRLRSIAADLVARLQGAVSSVPGAPRHPRLCLCSERVTVLDVCGSLLYAGSRTLQVKLPDPAAAERAVLVLRLRDGG
jgi:hypothetical protein